MWDFIFRQLLRQTGGKIAGRCFNEEANRPEAYADRIKRDFHLHEYADAWALYDSDPAYWERWYDTQPDEPNWKNVFVRDSAAAAGVPGRNNVLEYGFPDSGSREPLARDGALTSRSARRLIRDNDLSLIGRLPGLDASNPIWPRSLQSTLVGSKNDRPRFDIFGTGSSSGPSPPPDSQHTPGGLPGMMAATDIIDRSNPDRRPLGGLGGLLQEYLRNNSLRTN